MWKCFYHGRYDHVTKIFDSVSTFPSSTFIYGLLIVYYTNVIPSAAYILYIYIDLLVGWIMFWQDFLIWRGQMWGGIFVFDWNSFVSLSLSEGEMYFNWDKITYKCLWIVLQVLLLIYSPAHGHDGPLGSRCFHYGFAKNYYFMHFEIDFGKWVSLQCIILSRDFISKLSKLQFFSPVKWREKES